MDRPPTSIEARDTAGLPTGFVAGLAHAVLRGADPSRLVAAHREHIERFAAGVRGELAIVGIGKASLAMTSAAAGVVGPRRGRCVAIAPRGSGAAGSRFTAHEAEVSGVDVLFGSHPVADGQTVVHAAGIASLAESLGSGDGLVMLVSGGGSALSTLPFDAVALDELLGLTGELLRSGATIHELNTVRGACERLKAGGLFRLAHPARMLSLIMSDVVGDDPSIIASGLGAAGHPDPVKAMRVIERYGLQGRAPTVEAWLVRPQGAHEIATAREDASRPRPTVQIIGNNAVVRGEAERWLRDQGFALAFRQGGVTGEASEVARGFVADARAACAARGAAVLGGETTVTVDRAPGIGGRNQEFALAAAMELRPGEVVITLATDGVDGPTDAAGAAVDHETIARIRAAGVDPVRALAEHDSHPALAAAGALIRTGPTGTNLNDLAVYLRL